MGVNPKKYSDLFSPYKIKAYATQLFEFAVGISVAVRSGGGCQHGDWLEHTGLHSLQTGK